MKDKVCDYELAKELHELDFDCPSHTGYWLHWIRETDYYKWFSSTGEVDIFLKENNYPRHDLIEAYCSDDLLMWFEEKAPANLLFTTIQGDQILYGYDSLDTSIDHLDPKPSNALAKAIITILKGKNNE